MTPDAFRAALAALGLTQVGVNGADRFLGVDGRTVRRWISGELSIPGSVAMLLRVMLARRLSVATVRKICDMTDA